MAKDHSSLSDLFSSSSSEEDVRWLESRKGAWERIKKEAIKEGDWEIVNKSDVMPVRSNRKGNLV